MILNTGRAEGSDAERGIEIIPTERRCEKKSGSASEHQSTERRCGIATESGLRMTRAIRSGGASRCERTTADDQSAWGEIRNTAAFGPTVSCVTARSVVFVESS